MRYRNRSTGRVLEASEGSVKQQNMAARPRMWESLDKPEPAEPDHECECGFTAKSSAGLTAHQRSHEAADD